MKNYRLQSQNLAWVWKDPVAKIQKTAQTIWQSRHHWLPSSIDMVEEMPEIFIRNDEGKIHKFSDLLEIWIFVAPWTFHTQALFQHYMELFFCKYCGWGASESKNTVINSDRHFLIKQMKKYFLPASRIWDFHPTSYLSINLDYKIFSP